MMYDFIIAGGGIIGLATARALIRRHPSSSILVLEKEEAFSLHQTGHNSGVIHSGVYYRPGSDKARLAREGGRAVAEFCRTSGIPYEICGKVIVAADEEELPRLHALAERSQKNQIDVRVLTPGELQEREPHVRGAGAILVPSTGIVSYRQVSETLVRQLADLGLDLRTGVEVLAATDAGDRMEVATSGETFQGRWLINCAGLQSDRVARRSGTDPGLRIIPFRGEYYELKPERRHLVRHLVYPVPDPEFPFLGVHFTRMIDGRVEAGPNAVLSLKREGYRKTDFRFADAWDSLTYPGMWRLAARHWKNGAAEAVRSFSKAAFVRSLQRLIPEIQTDDLSVAPAGVRAQALRPDGALVDDFAIISRGRAVHVCNAPSPAATASFGIAEVIAQRLDSHMSGRVPATGAPSET